MSEIEKILFFYRPLIGIVKTEGASISKIPRCSKIEESDKSLREECN